MSERPKRGISCQGLDAAFDVEEGRVSNLILEARMLQARQRPDEAASKYAEVAPIQERLADICDQKGLVEKAWVHRFDAVRAWALAGNYLAAITVGNALLSRPELPERLRQRIQEYTQSLRDRRTCWSAELASPSAGRNGNGTATVVRDPETGQTYLKVPLPEPEMVEPTLRAVGTALEGLRK
jgi:hypothetical protein